MISLEGLQQKTIDALKDALHDLDDQGIKYQVTSAFRTVDQQKALYAQGRNELSVVNELRKKAGMFAINQSDNSYTVTNCDGIKFKSRHQSGLAVDVVPLTDNGPIWPPLSSDKWKPIASAMKKHGFIWGGDWKDFPDAPHYELNV